MSHKFHFYVFILGLYAKGLVYLDVPINDSDCIVGLYSIALYRVGLEIFLYS
jgi:hypothetical protein